MRRLPLLLLLAGCATAGPAEPVRGRDLLPLEPGRIWVFTGDGGTATIKVLNLKSDPGWTLSLSLEAGLTWRLAEKPEGIVFLATGAGASDVSFDPPLLLVPNTVVTGTGWSTEAGFQGGSELRIFLQGFPDWESVRAGGKSYPARRIEFSASTPGKESKERSVFRRLWLSPSVGIVRVERLPVKLPFLVDSPGLSWDLVEVKKAP